MNCGVSVDKKEVEYLQSLLEIFRIEAQEHLAAISSGLVELEKANTLERASLVETIYREAHSLKGAARAVNLGEIESLCQKLESVFAEMKRAGAMGSPQLFDILHSAVSELDAILQVLHTPRSVAEKARTDELCRQLESASQHLFSPLRTEMAATAVPEVVSHGEKAITRQGSGVQGPGARRPATCNQWAASERPAGSVACKWAIGIRSPEWRNPRSRFHGAGASIFLGHGCALVARSARGARCKRGPTAGDGNYRKSGSAGSPCYR